MHRVICDGGLANRLNSLITALVIMESTKKPWGISWPTNNWCGAPFEELFKTSIPVNQNNLVYFKKHENRFWNIFHENQIGFNENRITYNKDIHSLEQLCEIILKHNRVAYFHHLIPTFITEEQFKKAWEILKPHPQIEQKVKELTEKYKIDNQTVGIHIRKTDFGDLVNDQKIYDAVKKSNKKHLICSDSNEIIDKFSKLPNCVSIPKPSYPKKLNANGGWNSTITDTEGRTYPFNISRDSESVKWGLIDLLLLGKTEIVLTSSSTFLAFASRIHQSLINSKPLP